MCEVVIDPMVTPGLQRVVLSVIKRLRSRFRGFPACWFIVLTFSWSWGIWSILRLNPSLTPFSRAWTYIYVAGLSGPLAGAALTSFLAYGTDGLHALLARLFLARTSALWFALAILLAPALWIVAEKIGRHHPAFVASPIAMFVVWLKMLIRGGPLTEEIGWRGFLLPLLLGRMNLFRASAIMFPIWALWHLPLWFIPGLPHHDWSLVLFLLWLAPGTFLFSWFYVKGQGKVWLPILFHTSVNFSLFFSSVVPAQHNRGFLFLVIVTWMFVGILVLVNRAVWFANVSVAAENNTVRNPALSADRASMTYPEYPRDSCCG